MKNFRHKEYNPCGDLTGKERDFCDEATKNYFNMPYVEIMRIIAVKAVAEFENQKNFQNVAALENWASYNLNDVEQRANLDFESFTTLQAGICKYFVHLLYENRYNIHYNCLADYCGGLDDKIFRADLTNEQLERKINSLAQEANHFSRVNDLIAEFLNFISV